VAEWQTRTVQVRVSVRTWGFNSPLAHHLKTQVDLRFLSWSTLRSLPRYNDGITVDLGGGCGHCCGWLTRIKSVGPTVENVTSDDDRDGIVARRGVGSSPKTIGNYHGLLAADFKDAVEKGADHP
jgi:hypothetical protein